MEINRGRDGSWQRSKRFRYQSLGDVEFLFLGKVYMTQLLLLGKFEYTGGPIFKVVLEC